MGKVEQLRPKSEAQGQAVTAKDGTPVIPASKVRLRHRPTGKVTSHFVVDAREILAPANTEYERIPGEWYPQSMSPPNPPPEAA